ncbi:hypothetical protein NPIL_241 [Nephila pilipes]|uniref:Uncharacterized protein n=1 Tax=Nephila pilipes TaxID=299642 RepID=A0A8X6QV49_NEPPI|nr:hypothetical protein NPIL_241 [Nephila pilipes]
MNCSMKKHPSTMGKVKNLAIVRRGVLRDRWSLYSADGPCSCGRAVKLRYPRLLCPRYAIVGACASIQEVKHGSQLTDYQSANPRIE